MTLFTCEAVNRYRRLRSVERLSNPGIELVIADWAPKHGFAIEDGLGVQYSHHSRIGTHTYTYHIIIHRGKVTTINKIHSSRAATITTTATEQLTVRFVVVAVLGHVARRCGRWIHHLGGVERFRTGATRDIPKLIANNEPTRSGRPANWKPETGARDKRKTKMSSLPARRAKTQGRNSAITRNGGTTNTYKSRRPTVLKITTIY